VNSLRRSRKDSTRKYSGSDVELPSASVCINPATDPPSHLDDPDDRLDSWKQIAVYLGREVRTVQRWEKREHLPVHRHVHRKIGSIFAFKREIENWRNSRSLSPVHPVPQNGTTKLVDGAPLVFSEHSGSKTQTPSARFPGKLSWAWDNMESIPAIIYFRPDTAAFPFRPHAEQPEYLAVVGISSRHERSVNFSPKRMAAAKS